MLRFCRDYVGRKTSCRVIVRSAALGLPNWFARPRFVDHLGNPDAVVRKNLLPASFLNLVMAGMHPPRGHRSFILPYLIRQQQVFAGQALESINEEATTHGRERGLQRSRKVHVAVY